MPLKIGDRVRLSGGYDMEPHWLNSELAYKGTVCSFIPGQNSALAAVVELDYVIQVDAAVGQIVVLELRYADAEWNQEAVVHVELCDFIPEARPWPSRRQGKWIESNATCSLIESDAL